MSAKHTPGPWEAVGNLVRSQLHQPQGLPAGVQIADCRDGYFLAHTDEAKANARLIAAAPRMSAALQRAASILAELPPSEQKPRILAIRQEIVETIKQATPEFFGIKPSAMAESLRQEWIGR